MSNLIPERLLSTRIIDKDHPIIHTTIIKADNALDYVDRVNPDHSTLTNVAPPLDNMFIQMHVYEDFKDGSPPADMDIGVFIEAQRVNSDEFKDIGWLLHCSLWNEPLAQKVIASMNALCGWEIVVNRDGSLKSIEWIRNDTFWVRRGKDAGQTYERIITAALFVINFLNCKNVILEEQEPSKRERRMEQKHGKQAFRYHLLKVRSASKTYALGDGKGSRDQYSTHIVRGHFKTYTDAAPLMGRFVGTYWWDAHVAGRDKAHVVDKDYAVEPPVPAANGG